MITQLLKLNSKLFMHAIGEDTITTRKKTEQKLEYNGSMNKQHDNILILLLLPGKKPREKLGHVYLDIIQLSSFTKFLLIII